MLVLGVGLSFWMNARLSLVFFVCTPILGAALFFIMRRVAPLYSRLQAAVDHVNGCLLYTSQDAVYRAAFPAQD